MEYFATLSDVGAWQGASPTLSALKGALEASWDSRTAYHGQVRPGNPAFGQCYPTARVVQWFYPDYDVVRGEVWTGSTLERHFWNVMDVAGGHRIDLSWEQFPSASVIRWFELLDTGASSDSEATQARCALLLKRVLARLEGGEHGSFFGSVRPDRFSRSPPDPSADPRPARHGRCPS